MYDTFRINEGVNPKSNRLTKAIIVENIVQMAIVSEDKVRKINGNNNNDAAICKKVAA
jgi:hypothetical protein